MMKEINQQAEKLMNVAHIENASFYISGEIVENKDDGDESKASTQIDDSEHADVFTDYLQKAADYYSLKKTLLYVEKPRPFYEFYVCSNVSYYKSRILGDREDESIVVISDATPKRLEEESRYIVITGTGGMGKSMFLTHLFLSSVKEYVTTGVLPILSVLRAYDSKTQDMVDFIFKAVNAFDAKISRQDIVRKLENKEISIMLDGLDELASSLREKFNSDLNAFIKAYPGNRIAITSRPTEIFLSYPRFSLFELDPLTKKQALQLIEKLHFWNENAKKRFITALDSHLYETHWNFASNPLLLTIMLRTYTTFGEVPAKMHVFYAKAYDTMACLHDATKESYKRPFQTKLAPGDFAKLFSEFCARTYAKEMIDFTEKEFNFYMDKVIRRASLIDESMKKLTPQDFISDITNNLCIMYKEGEKIYFIHRSFQEYFAAYHFAFYYYDKDLKTLGEFFENMKISKTDETFDMLYDMVSERIELCIFLPYLEDLMNHCDKFDGEKAYWEFLEKQYKTLYHNEGETGYCYYNEVRSFLYKSILKLKKLGHMEKIDELEWPESISDFYRESWVALYHDSGDIDSDGNIIYKADYVTEDEIPYDYTDENEYPDTVGYTYFIDIKDIREEPERYKEIKAFIEDSEFPLRQEYDSVRKYYNELKLRAQLASAPKNSIELFSD